MHRRPVLSSASSAFACTSMMHTWSMQLVMAFTVVAYIVMAYIVMAFIVMAYIVMPL